MSKKAVKSTTAKITSGSGKPPVSPPPEEKPKSDHLSLWVLLVCCATFLTLVYTNAKLNERIDKLTADQDNVINYCSTYASYLQSPFCYGYDANGVKGYGVDERKVTTPCKGFENYTKVAK